MQTPISRIVAEVVNGFCRPIGTRRCTPTNVGATFANAQSTPLTMRDRGGSRWGPVVDARLGIADLSVVTRVAVRDCWHATVMRHPSRSAPGSYADLLLPVQGAAMECGRPPARPALRWRSSGLDPHAYSSSQSARVATVV